MRSSMENRFKFKFKFKNFNIKEKKRERIKEINIRDLTKVSLLVTNINLH